MSIPSEHVEQRELVAWFRRTYPDVLIFAIPNGGQRSKVQGAKLKLEGVVPGVPDLFVPEWKLFIEMKRQKNGRISADQKTMITYLAGVGYDCIVGYGCDDAKLKINEMRGQK